MKRNKILPLIILVSTLLGFKAIAQDVSINIFPLQTSILDHTSAKLEVTICNEDPDPDLSSPESILMPIISFPDNLNIVGVENSDGTPLTTFTIQSLDNSPGVHTIRLIYNPSLPNAECVIFNIKLLANGVGSGTTTASLSFDGPQTDNNNPANDNATAVLPVDPNLPVTLAEFNVTAEGKIAQLKWSTTEETNSDHFDVQKSSDGKSWLTFERVAALGESSSLHPYVATDNDPFSGQNFYRLHMIDKDGSSAYSRMRNVNFDVEQTSFYPNPVTSELRIKTPDFSKVEHISIVNTSGMKVYQSGSKAEETIDVSKFNSGVYVVRLKLTNGEESNYKIVVNK